MPRFPTTQADIVTLANLMIYGFMHNTAVYPSPPQNPMVINMRLGTFKAARDDAIAASAAAEQAVADKDAALAALIEAMKTDLRYAENTVSNDDAKLNLIGWGAKASPTALLPPGQPLELIATEQGEGTITLQWQSPIASPASGKVQAYKVVRQTFALEEGDEEGDADDGTVADVATAVDTTAELIDQPLRKKLQYTIIAINKAGMGMPSNTVEVVL